MKQNYITSVVGLILLITITACVKQQGLGEYIPGTKCNIDTDCKYISWTTSVGKTGSMCAVPEEYSRFFNVSVNVDSSKECYCMPSQDLGPINVCALKSN